MLELTVPVPLKLGMPDDVLLLLGVPVAPELEDLDAPEAATPVALELGELVELLLDEPV